jgi:NADPH:quinone reductase-like Zn-dependent oxidoreductase
MGIQLLGSDPYRYEEFATAWATYCAGGFTSVIDSVFALRDGAAAQDKMMRSDFFGKILLEP